MQDTNIPIKRKKRKKKSIFGYLLLFAFVFILALYSLLYLVESYSPDVDVNIGNSDALTLSDDEMDVEIKPVDERLKWIQMEDEMPSAALRQQEKYSEKDTNKEQKKETSDTLQKKKEKTKKEPPKPSIEDLKKAKIDFQFNYDENKSKVIPAKTIQVPAPSISNKSVVEKSITKIYLGSYNTIEEAMEVQHKVSLDVQGIIPFIKSVNGKYIVQMGSFADENKADILISKMRTKGYNPKVKKEIQ